MEWGLGALREAGITIEIDDFGTSQASILSVHRIQPDGIKIARELVTPLPGSETFRWAVRHVLELAQHLSISAIAEGVETTEQASDLIAMGCTVHQWFRCSKPLPERAFWPLVGQSHAKLAAG